MREIDSEHGPGVVAVVTATVARFHEFTDSIASLQVPYGTRWSRVSSCNIVANRNRVMDTLPIGTQWVWWLDDDNAFGPETLVQLLDRRVDLIAPLVAARTRGFVPMVHHPVVAHRPYTWQELQDADAANAGLVPVSGASTSGTLVKKAVWEKVLRTDGPPLYRVDSCPDKESFAEDIWFSHRATQLGFKCYVDTRVYMDHLNTITLRPGRTPDGKLAVYGVIDNAQIGLIRTV